jgi:hypothetical protein
VRKVDWDLLADHLGGALSGTPEERRVAHLVATDPHWRQAAARLTEAMAAVAGDLRALPELAMPADVADRLDQALRAASAGAEDPPSGGHLADRAPAQRRSPTRRPGGRSSGGPHGARPSTPAGGRRPRPARRALRWGSGLAAAAGVMAFAVLGISTLSGLDDGDSGLVTASDGDVETAPDGRGLSLQGPDLRASGTHYQRSDFNDRTVGPFGLAPEPDDRAGEPGLAEAPGPGAEEAPPSGGGAPREADVAPDAVPDGLRHLWPLPASCVAAVEESFMPTQITLHLADYAHFEGGLAVVIWIVTAGGDHWVAVVGTDCGSPGAGADERHRVLIG